MSGWAIDNGCFMRYDWTPFFGQNQPTDITSLLWDGNSSKKRYIIGVCVGGVTLLLLALFVWSRGCKNRVRGQQVSVNGTVNYNYKRLQLATNNFSEMNIIGKGGFGEVFKVMKRSICMDDEECDLLKNNLQMAFALTPSGAKMLGLK
ncbi:hypothetical protein M8C21_003659 [Ambrosia artemisiifolia]|uniref:Uncharacterized protein n=1 Tax=Ambrosia artemisiifolia TaxID=4212 RepID=A0AAD5CJF3_AMBAR|nr:hypothetical protein M8C21_003659 [Ambrosia artemisiifolia]